MALTPGRTGEADLRGLSILNATVSATFSVSSLATAGNGTYVAPLLRLSGGYAYRMVSRVAPGGRLYLSLQRVDGNAASVTTLASVTSPAVVNADQQIRIEFSATGSSPVELGAKVWTTTSTTPTASATFSDASSKRLSANGAVGVWGYISGSSSGTKISFDELAVRDQAAVPEPEPEPEPEVPGSTVVEPETTAGSAAIGSTAYAAPASAIYVATTGSDTAAGTMATPVRTLGRAVALAPSGSTIVMRAGSYHETVALPRAKKLTVQSYPREAVWLDGSSVVSGFVASGDAWVKTGWTTEFDSSPTYSRGNPDSTTPGWQWVNPNYPMAAHPDQVWINGVELKQVGSRALVVTGTFYVDYATDRLYVGTDPSGKQVRASDLIEALSIFGPGSVVRGLGVRRYAPSVPDMGTMKVNIGATDVSLENLVLTDNATTGLSVAGLRATLKNVTSSSNGLLGIHTVYADGLRATGLRVVDNNTERFNPAPAAGGHKVTRSRNVRISDSVFNRNYGSGLWFDESVYDVQVTTSDMIGNGRNGLNFELSSKIVAANNDIRNNAYTGLLIQNSNQAEIWNNTVSGSALTVWITQDSRQSTNLSTAGHDPRQSLPDPTVTWVTEKLRFSNNVFGDPVAGDNWCGVLCFEDKTKTKTAAQAGITLNGNVYSRTNKAVPPRLIRWAAGAAGMTNYDTLADFKRATGLESAGAEVAGRSALDASGRFVATTVTTAVGVTAPALITDILGLSAGARVIGPQRAD